MNLMDLINRAGVPEPWTEGEKIPWDEPGFSERMLEEHLSQEHDAASRRFEYIDTHVDWIHRELLGGRPARVLDLGCGPGLYTSRLARLGHTCVGIDFSPASVAYARDEAQREGLACTYVHQDLRAADYGTGFDLVMFIFGELNAFRPADAETILRKARGALADGGVFLLEVSRFEALEKWGKSGPSWYSSPIGLFSDRPHLCLEETFWDEEQSVVTRRFFVVDAESGEVTPHAMGTQAYTDEGYRGLLGRCGFEDVTFSPSLPGGAELFPIVARKGW
ncbi:MAG: class I SAM-dependent methyltransferase [Anaerolineae bacterium]|nr:class I SAM-dependent methyltransferase [Anaerolineae bacterium]